MTQEQEIINLVQYLDTHPWVLVMFMALAIWTIIWKGTALWKAAQNKSVSWFVVLLLVNTMGILEIIYIFFFSKKNNDESRG